jgi:hypothetical protein
VNEHSPVINPEIQCGFKLIFLLRTGGLNPTLGKIPKFESLSNVRLDNGLFNLFTKATSLKNPLILVWVLLPAPSLGIH